MRWVLGGDHHVRGIFGGHVFRGLAFVAAAISLAPSDARAQTPFTLQRLGFYDASHTRNDGVQTSGLFGLTGSGVAVGYSLQYSGATTLGGTLWIEPAASSAPIAVGLYDAEHKRANGSYSISMAQVTESGLTRGASERFLGGTVDLGQTAWVTSAAGVTATVGFYDAGHTGAGGFKSSAAMEMNEAGDVRGTSQRFGAGGGSLGQTAWIGSVAGSTTLVGFTDPAQYQRADGFRFSAADFLNAVGKTAGFSNRYLGGTDYLGEAAWTADRTGVTTRVGLFGTPEFQDASGYAYSAVQQLTDTGRTMGSSDRFSGLAATGEAAWVADATGVTTRVGFTDAEYTRNDGYQSSTASAITDSGLVRGYSQRFSGGAVDLGLSAWVANSGGSTFKVGFYDAEHTRTGGYQQSTSGAINGAGLVAGTSERYDGADARGQSAWKAAFDGLSQPATIRIGFTDTEHTAANGSQTSTPERMTQSGIVGGSSRRYSGGELFLGQSAWMVAGGSSTTVKIGLTTAEFTRADGWKYSEIDQMTESGHVSGRSDRFNGGAADLGQAAWVASIGSSTQRVGLIDAMHTSADGSQFSEPDFLTESGFAAGESDRFNGTANELGQTAWVFDLNTSALTPFVFSARADGYAFSEVTSLLENGWVLGDYTLFDAGGVDLGKRAFVWTPTEGAFDLGSRVDGGLSAEGFKDLLDASDGTLSGSIAGEGTPLANGGQAVFLAQAVPEPGTVFLLMLSGSLSALIAIRRRRTNSRLL